VSTGQALLLSAFLLAANAFFVGAEFALISARRSSIELRAAGGNPIARITLGAMERVSLMMAGAQLGITICSLGLGYLGEPAIAHALEGPFETLGIPEALVHPVAFTIALAIRSSATCTSCSARWSRRTSRSPARAARRSRSPRRSRGSSGSCTRSSRCSTGSPTASCAPSA
jgi:hypothetical protein